ncbi:MAG TPA: response regulator transcription factor [Noviherbaspirillum sp.]|nr:response regulator transcription factor [Noviherbaspirillum sp.]
MEKTILVVDDDAELRQLLHEYFGERGYRVLLAADGMQMWEQIRHNQIELIILDLMLPGDDGLVLCRNLRTYCAVPILMLTARGDDMDRILGLEMGADDYLHKPFIPRELLARVKNMLWRAGAGAAALAPARELHFAGWMLDLNAHHLVDRDGIVAPLSAGEFRMLRTLAENPHRVMSREQLLEASSGREHGPFDRTVDVIISRLRRRLGDDGGENGLIKTVRSEGYMLAAAVERKS